MILEFPNKEARSVFLDMVRRERPGVGTLCREMWGLPYIMIEMADDSEPVSWLRERLDRFSGRGFGKVQFETFDPDALW
ncbi:MAG TPA: hypothetical protein VEX87_26330 [Skermanella sp.]|jgi:hypothetical protein|nr:hypothetical protein [Skermanella sp.]